MALSSGDPREKEVFVCVFFISFFIPCERRLDRFWRRNPVDGVIAMSPQRKSFMQRLRNLWRTSRANPRFRVRLDELEDRTAPALVGQTLYPTDNPWNQKISSAPVAANSAAIMNNIVTRYGNGRIHPDFGQDDRAAGADLYGIPYNIVHGNSTPKVSVVID